MEKDFLLGGEDFSSGYVADADHPFLGRLFRDNPIPMYVYDLSTLKFMRVNEAAIRHYGYSNDEFLRMSLLDIRPKSEAIRLVRILKMPRAVTSKFNENGEWIHHKKDGSIIYVEVATQLLIQNGKKVVLTVANDVTERRKAQVELKHSEERFRRLSEATFEGVVIHRSGIICEANQAFARMLGYVDRDDVVGLDVFEMVAVPFRDLARRKVKNKEDTDYVMEFVKKDRSRIIVAVRGKTIVYQGLEARIAAIQDITEWKRNEEQLRERESRLRILQQQVPAVVWSTDLDLRILSSSGSALEKLGLKTDQTVGMTIQEYVGSNDVNFLPNAKHFAALRGESVSYEHDWQGIHFFVHIDPLRSAGGDIIGTVAIAVDLTEQKKTERALRDTTARLERSNKELEQFACVISHDLQEPLRTINNYVSLIQRECKGILPGEVETDIAYISKAAKRMSDLIRDLLAFSQLEEVPLDYRTEIDFSRIVGQTVENLASMVRESSAEIEILLLPKIYVRTHPSEIIQLFQNLFSNAIKFRNRKRSLKISVSCKRKLDSHEFSVEDNGMGFNPAHSEKIFRIFQRLHSAEGYPGTGIGLSICQNIVEKLGGKIWARSEEGKGSTFSFTIPA